MKTGNIQYLCRMNKLLRSVLCLCNFNVSLECLTGLRSSERISKTKNVQQDISPADVDQFWHGSQRQTYGEVYQMHLNWVGLCAEKLEYYDSERYWVQNISVHPFLSPVGGKKQLHVKIDKEKYV